MEKNDWGVIFIWFPFHGHPHLRRLVIPCEGDNVSIIWNCTFKHEQCIDHIMVLDEFETC